MTGPSHPAKLAHQAAYWRANGRPDVAEAIEADLAGGGRCLKCGRRLTASRSVETSIGPECAKKGTPDHAV
jgi:hypothetical protein